MAWEAVQRGSLQDELFPYLGLVTCDHFESRGSLASCRGPQAMWLDMSRASAPAPMGGMKPQLRTNDPRIRQPPIPEHSSPSSCMDVY